jgi:hypothetical protein
LNASASGGPGHCSSSGVIPATAGDAAYSAAILAIAGAAAVAYALLFALNG